jgi:nucleoside-diphosphate-sugar epimerase
MRVILTGTMGMVGEGVLLACLEHASIDEVPSVSRRSRDRTHAKLKELLAPDFLALTELPAGFDVCFYCAGVSSVGMTEANYTRATHDTAVHFAKLIASPRMTLTSRGRAPMVRKRARRCGPA